MKKSKASEGKNGVDDMISNLPDPILHLILSRLPTTEQVVRTSILSPRWRYLWTSVPSIDLDYTRGHKPPTTFNKNKFQDFVYWVLVNKTLDLESFRLRCLNYYNMSTVGRWVQAAVMQKVKLLDLVFDPMVDVIELPNCLVTCDTLEVLRLYLYTRPVRLPTVTCFPALRVLELNRVKLLNSGSVQQFLKSCPLLEELSLVDCLLSQTDGLHISCPNLKSLKIDNRNLLDAFLKCHYVVFVKHDCLWYFLRISCPKLVVLEYAGHAAYQFMIDNPSSLKKAVIYPDDMAHKDLSFESFVGTMFQLFTGVSLVESLSLNLYFIQAISVALAHDPNGDFPASLLPKLKTLEVSTTIDDYTMSVVIRILRCSPNLESLHLIIQKEIYLPEVWEVDKILTRHLKRVEFVELNGEERKLDMARFLLEQGNDLEEMVFSWRDEVNYHEKSTETMKEVLKYRKASSKVKLITLLKE